MVEITASKGKSSDMIILGTSIEYIQTINQNIDAVSSEILTQACRNDTDGMTLVSITRIDVFFAMHIYSQK